MIAVAIVESIEKHQVQSGDRGFWLQTGSLIKVFSCGEANGGSWVGPGRRVRWRGRMARHQATERPSEGSVETRLKRKQVEQRREREFYRC
jgi:hypothetical protein